MDISSCKILHSTEKMRVLQVLSSKFGDIFMPLLHHNGKPQTINLSVYKITKTLAGTNIVGPVIRFLLYFSLM